MVNADNKSNRVLPVWASTIALSLSVLRSALNLLPRPSQCHGPNTWWRLQNSHRFCPCLQRHHSHPPTHLRETHCSLSPQPHRPPPWHHIAAEDRRRAVHLDLHYPSEPYSSMMSVFWLLPQFFVMATAEVFTYVGQWEFFYDEATDGTRSTCYG